jgi:hypothetical protein
MGKENGAARRCRDAANAYGGRGRMGKEREDGASSPRRRGDSGRDAAQHTDGVDGKAESEVVGEKTGYSDGKTARLARENLRDERLFLRFGLGRSHASCAWDRLTRRLRARNRPRAIRGDVGAELGGGGGAPRADACALALGHQVRATAGLAGQALAHAAGRTLARSWAGRRTRAGPRRWRACALARGERQVELGHARAGPRGGGRLSRWAERGGKEERGRGRLGWAGWAREGGVGPFSPFLFILAMFSLFFLFTSFDSIPNMAQIQISTLKHMHQTKVKFRVQHDATFYTPLEFSLLDYNYK